MNSCIVSICMITYNHEPFIAQAIDGVLMQKTNFQIELVISEDCSIDRTREICIAYQTKYPEIIKLKLPEKNLGMMPNFIQTLGYCTGKYVALCEGDDYWTDTYKLQKQVDLLEKNPHCSMCVAKSELRKNNELIMILGEGNKAEYNFYDTLYGTYFHTSTYLIKKIYIDQYVVANKNLQTGDTSLRYFLSDLGPFIFLNKVVSVYRQHENGVWTSLNSYERLKANIKLHESFNKYFKHKYRIDFQKLLIREYYQLIKLSLNNNNLKEFFASTLRLLFWELRNPKHLSLYLIRKIKTTLRLGSK